MPSGLRLGLLGFGNIGMGVYRALQNNGQLLERRLGRRLEIVRIVDQDIEREREVEVAAGLLTTDVDSLLADPAIDVVVELIGGVEPAREYVTRALEAGKHVVTANKALLGAHLAQLLGAASENGVQLLFEASVGGGIPCLRAMKQGLIAGRFRRVTGIVNSTCNYILTRMIGAGEDLSQALADAQALGYAEVDPSRDLEGIDSAQKCAILASLAFGQNVQTEDVYTEGITALQPLDVAFAAANGYALKLLALAARHDEGDAVEVRVHPVMIPVGSILASVKDVFNAVLVESDLFGSSLFYGRGAGPEPTAGAVLSDLAALANESQAGERASRDQALEVDATLKNILPMAEVECAYYLRITPSDALTAGSLIATEMARQEIRIRKYTQTPRADGGLHDILTITEKAREAKMRAALTALEDKIAYAEPPVLIRIEDNLTGLS